MRRARELAPNMEVEPPSSLTPRVGLDPHVTTRPRLSPACPEKLLHATLQRLGDRAQRPR